MTFSSSQSLHKKIFQLALQPGFSAHDKKAAMMKIVDLFQNQIKKEKWFRC
jgi:hypothetical protein